MNHSMKATECPKCGEKELGKGKQTGYGSMSPKGKIVGSAVEYIVCTTCGFIIEGYVKQPHKFKGTWFER